MNTMSFTDDIISQIVSYPCDLCFFVWRARQGFIWYLSRGPMVASGRLLYTSGPVHPTAESVIAEIKAMLEEVLRRVLAGQKIQLCEDCEPRKYSFSAAFGTLLTGTVFCDAFIDWVVKKLSQATGSYRGMVTY